MHLCYFAGAMEEYASRTFTKLTHHNRHPASYAELALHSWRICRCTVRALHNWRSPVNGDKSRAIDVKWVALVVLKRVLVPGLLFAFHDNLLGLFKIEEVVSYISSRACSHCI